MPSQFVEFDIPQNLLSIPSAFYQGVGGHDDQHTGVVPRKARIVTHTHFADDVRGYDNQHIRVVPRKARIVTGAGSDDCVLSYVYDHPQPKKDFTEQLRALHQHYTILDDDRTLTELLETEPALYLLLIEAVEPLRHAFGDKRIIHVRVQSSDEDSILKVAVQLPADFEGDTERALRSFDKDWWLNNCHRSGGTLVFDYEMQDAIQLA